MITIKYDYGILHVNLEKIALIRRSQINKTTDLLIDGEWFILRDATGELAERIKKEIEELHIPEAVRKRM